MRVASARGEEHTEKRVQTVLYLHWRKESAKRGSGSIHIADERRVRVGKLISDASHKRCSPEQTFMSLSAMGLSMTS